MGLFTLAFGTARAHKGIDNQAGDLAPRTSPWGQLFSNARSQLITNPTPIGTDDSPRFKGTVGFMTTAVASMTPLVTESGFGGDVPTSQQGWVDAPDPWNRP